MLNSLNLFIHRKNLNYLHLDYNFNRKPCRKGSRLRYLGSWMARVAFLLAWYYYIAWKMVGQLVVSSIRRPSFKGYRQDCHQAACRVTFRFRTSSVHHARYSRHDAWRYQAEQSSYNLATLVRGLEMLESQHSMEGEINFKILLDLVSFEVFKGWKKMMSCAGVMKPSAGVGRTSESVLAVC